MVKVRFDKRTLQWIEVSADDKQEGDLYFDGRLYKVLQGFQNRMRKKNKDVVLIIDGREGTGKSTMMGNILEFISDGNLLYS